MEPDHLNNMNSTEGLLLLGNYYLARPEAELIAWLSSHTNSRFLTIVHQCQIVGLQVVYENQWIDIPHLLGR